MKVKCLSTIIRISTKQTEIAYIVLREAKYDT